GRVHLRKHLLGGERIGQQLAPFYPLAYVFEQLEQRFVPLPLDQKIERGQDRQSRLDQRQKLLIENQKRGLPHLAPPPELASAGVEDGPGLDPVNEVSLLHEPVVDLRFRIPILHLLPQMALFVGDFDQELCHALSSASEASEFPASTLIERFRPNVT